MTTKLNEGFLVLALRLKVSNLFRAKSGRFSSFQLNSLENFSILSHCKTWTWNRDSTFKLEAVRFVRRHALQAKTQREQQQQQQLSCFSIQRQIQLPTNKLTTQAYAYAYV